MDEHEYKVILHKTARRDIDKIIDYLNTFSPLAADNQYDEFIRKIDSLAFMPLRCPPARNEALAQRGYHYLIVRHYLVFFTVSGNTVKVRRIVDGRSDYNTNLIRKPRSTAGLFAV